MIYPKAIINLKNLRNNIRYIKSIIHDSSDIIPIVKANAYGHGYKKIIKVLNNENIKCVGVATVIELKEMIDLKLKFDVLHLGRLSKGNIDFYHHHNVIASINSIDDIHIINSKSNNIVRCHLKIDTGMNRMGCKINQFKEVLNKIMNSKKIKLEGIYSHLACSEDINALSNVKQIKLFESIIKKIKIKSLKYHILNSGGVFNFPNKHFDYARIGLSIYGISPFLKNDKNLKPVMKLVAPVVLIKEIENGEKIGYGCTFKANAKMKIGIVQCGYADGLPISFGNKGHVYFNKNKLPILGVVSMDLICIDCTNVKSIKFMDYVSIWGDERYKGSKLEFISKSFNTIPYFYLTNLSNRVKRVYVEK